MPNSVPSRRGGGGGGGQSQTTTSGIDPSMRPYVEKGLSEAQRLYETYKPIPNHIDKNGTYCGIDSVNYSFETYGEENTHLVQR